MLNEDLIKQIRAGQQSALILLYTTYREKFIRVMTSKYTRDVNLSTELYQTAVVILYENIMNERLVTLNHENSLWSYIFKTGVYLYNDQLRYFQKTSGFTEDLFDKLNHEIEDEDRLENRALQEEEKVVYLRLMQNALEELGEPCSKLLELFYYEKKSMNEIAELLDYNNSDTAKTQKYKCTKRLRKIFIKISKIN